MKEIIKYLFQSYLENFEPNLKKITSNYYSLLKYHRLDMLLADHLEGLILLTELDKSLILQKKEKISDKNNQLLREALRLSELLKVSL